MPKLVSRLCLDLRADGPYVYTCTLRKGHNGQHCDLASDRNPLGGPYETRWSAEPLSDRARAAVAFDTADLSTRSGLRRASQAIAEAINGRLLQTPAQRVIELAYRDGIMPFAEPDRSAGMAPTEAGIHPLYSDAEASWLSRRPTGAELAEEVAKLDGPDDDEDDDEDAAAEPEVSEYDPGDEVDDEGGMSEYRPDPSMSFYHAMGGIEW